MVKKYGGKGGACIPIYTRVQDNPVTSTIVVQCILYLATVISLLLSRCIPYLYCSQYCPPRLILDTGTGTPCTPTCTVNPNL